MGRLTKRMPDGRVMATDMIEKPSGYVGNGIPILEKLAAYEDTGLLPEDINELKNDFADLVKKQTLRDAMEDY